VALNDVTYVTKFHKNSFSGIDEVDKAGKSMVRLRFIVRLESWLILHRPQRIMNDSYISINQSPKLL
jgi:hypothetical protein